MGELADWDFAEEQLKAALEERGIDYELNPGDGAFYGPKIDFHLEDAAKRTWQCGTIQLDFQLPQNFDLTYVEKDGTKVRPVMLHRVIFGSIERFIGILIEHYAGHFPTWLAPTQVMVVPVHYERHAQAANAINEKLLAMGFRSKSDARNEKLGYRIREAQLAKIPYQLVIGDGEVEANTVTVRRAQSKESVTMPVEEFIAKLSAEVKEKRL